MKTQKTLVIIILVILAILTIAIIAPSGNNPSHEATTKSEEDTTASFIKGLSPEDVFLNMEKQGFVTKKTFTEYGNSWVCSKEITGINFEVNIYSTTKSNIESVRATAMIDLSQKNIVATQQFFLYITSLPYDQANIEQAASWLKENFNNDKSSTTIGDVSFTIYAPSKAVRMLQIEAVK